jgi:hypothetical protein
LLAPKGHLVTLANPASEVLAVQLARMENLVRRESQGCLVTLGHLASLVNLARAAKTR